MARFSGAREPGGQPTADVAAARYRGQIVELREQTVLRRRLLFRRRGLLIGRKALQQSERERGASDAAAGKAQRGGLAFVELEVDVLQRGRLVAGAALERPVLTMNLLSLLIQHVGEREDALAGEMPGQYSAQMLARSRKFRHVPSHFS
jgi:hypothetical protein